MQTLPYIRIYHVYIMTHSNMKTIETNNYFMKCWGLWKYFDKHDLGQAFSHGFYNKQTGKFECAPERIPGDYTVSKRTGDDEMSSIVIIEIIKRSVLVWTQLLIISYYITIA